MNEEKIFSYFPKLTDIQKEQLTSLKPLYEEWNAKINVISRKDMDEFTVHHLLHSLAIAQIISFKNGTSILDVGTGGGFPGIPLAILFPNVDFLLIDSIGKKTKVAQAVIQSIGLTNVEVLQTRVEQLNESFDFIVSRAVTDLSTFDKWTQYKLRKRGFNTLPNGILYLKGGDLTAEIEQLHKKVSLYPINDYFSENYFQEKYVVYFH
ncbi:MAG: 16S rRNA (guanine(527)-N(7))-methyltransferase RsmG [Bacteroidales bacterium]|nr:16S rRNA (guanine(527)-N(7))-methyltransferase RsmG [Bacteroidales bacterium]